MFYNHKKLKTSLKSTAAGFTLIELLVVVLIIGILAAIALPQYQKAVERSRLSEALIMVKNIYEAEQIYRLTTGGYTNNFDDLDINIPGTKIEPYNRNSDFYRYVLQTGQSEASRDHVYATKNTTTNDRYDIVFYMSGIKYCMAFTQKTKDLCTLISKSATPVTCPPGTGKWNGLSAVCYLLN
jgi:type II secretion system protein G